MTDLLDVRRAAAGSASRAVATPSAPGLSRGQGREVGPEVPSVARPAGVAWRRSTARRHGEGVLGVAAMPTTVEARRVRVLVVDDHKTFAELLSSALAD